MAFDDEDDDSGYDKPVEEGKTYTVTVEDLGSKGDGIARVEGFVVFVPETEVGETVKVEINSVGRKFAFGEVVDRDVEAPAPAPEDEELDVEEVGEDVSDDTEEGVDEVDEFDDAGEEEDDRYEREEIDEVEDPFAADEL